MGKSDVDAHPEGFQFDINAKLAPLALLLKITQPGLKPLPKEVVTEKSMREFIWEQTQVKPIKVSLMNDVDSIIEFTTDQDIFEIAKKLHKVNIWGEYRIEIGTLMSPTNQIGNLIGNKQQEEKILYRYINNSSCWRKSGDVEMKYRVSFILLRVN